MIELVNITKIYNHGKKGECIALKKFNLTVEKGESVAIIGRTGSGKSTLLKLIAGLERATEGTIVICGKNITEMNTTEMAHYRNKTLGFIVQDYALIDSYTVRDNVLLPIIDKIPNKEKKIKCHILLKKVGLAHYEKKIVKKLSGGEKQRTAIARALINDPDILLCDEPTGALDEKTANEIMAIFNELSEQGKTILFVTHDPLVYNACDRIIDLTSV